MAMDGARQEWLRAVSSQRGLEGRCSALAAGHLSPCVPWCSDEQRVVRAPITDTEEHNPMLISSLATCRRQTDFNSLCSTPGKPAITLHLSTGNGTTPEDRQALHLPGETLHTHWFTNFSEPLWEMDVITPFYRQ